MSGLVNLAPNVRTYIAQMKVDPDFQRAMALPNGAERKITAAAAMQSAEADVAEGLVPRLEQLKEQGLVSSFEMVPLTGAMIINVPEETSGASWEAIRGVQELGRIVRNREVSMDAELGAFAEPKDPKAPAVTEYNVAKVNAPAAWAQGVTGKGVVVGVVDTGAEAGHEALKAHYRGTQADGKMVHDYNFYDPVNNKTEAYDDHGHGSHTAGTAVGGSAERLIGMAPDAKFIAAKVFTNRGSGSTATILKGLSWMLAPTDAAGKNPDPTKAPDIVSNSWGNSNGASLAYLDVFKAFDAAGIVPIVSAGNSGRGDRPSTIGSPASYDVSIAVAATDKDDNRAVFSSVGPSDLKDAKGNYIFKPDIAAPGVNVISAVPGGKYRAMSGTSMAAPGASGVAALLLSKYPDMSPAQVRDALVKGAVDLGEKGPDHFFGHGRIDAVAALKAADEMFKKPEPPAKGPQPKS